MRTVLITAVLAISLASCKSHEATGVEAVFQQYVEAVDASVDGTERAERAKGRAKRMMEQMRGFSEQFSEIGARLVRLSASYDAERSDFIGLVDEVEELRTDHMEKLIDEFFALKDELTADEWQAVQERMSSLRDR